MTDYSSTTGGPRSPLFGTATFSTLSATQTPLSPSRLSSSSTRSCVLLEPLLTYCNLIWIYRYSDTILVWQWRCLKQWSNETNQCLRFTFFPRFLLRHLYGRWFRSRTKSRTVGWGDRLRYPVMDCKPYVKDIPWVRYPHHRILLCLGPRSTRA